MRNFHPIGPVDPFYHYDTTTESVWEKGFYQAI